MATLTVIEKVIFLQNIDVFSAVPTESLAYMAAVAEEVEYPAGAVIFREGEHADGLYLVLEGKVRLARDDKEISTAGGKEAFGTWALFDNSPRVVTATVEEDCLLLRVDREDFVELLADHVEITQGVLQTLAGRLRGLVARVSPAG